MMLQWFKVTKSDILRSNEATYIRGGEAHLQIVELRMLAAVLVNDLFPIDINSIFGNMNIVFNFFLQIMFDNSIHTLIQS